MVFSDELVIAKAFNAKDIEYSIGVKEGSLNHR